VARHKFQFPQPTKADHELIKAAHDGNIGECLRALDDGGNVNAVSHSYATPLGEACWSNSVDIVRMLLERGADPNHIEGGKTPLMEAAGRCNRDLIEILIDAGANIEAKAELAPGAYIDIPEMAQNKDRILAVELRSLMNQQKKVQDGTKLKLSDVSKQLDLDDQGRPRTLD